MTDFSLLVSAGTDTSAQLERGQAETPVSDGFSRLSDSAGQSPLRISLLTCEDSVANSVQKWLNASAHHVKVTTAGFQQIVDNASDYQRFCTAGQLLIVAATSTEQFDESQLEILTGLVAGFPVIWPVVLGERSAKANVWWRQNPLSTHSARLEPLFLQTASTDGGGEVLFDPASALRSSLLLQQQVEQLQYAFATLAERQQRELSAIEVRQKMLEEPAQSAPQRGPMGTDKQVARVRERFAEELTQLEKQVMLKSDRNVQPLGKLTNLMRESSTRLKIEDLDKEESPLVQKLSVNASHLAAVNRKIEHALRQELTTDVNTIQQRVQHLTAQASITLQGFLGEQVLSAPPLVENAIWRTVENLMAIGKESNIELARKGFFDVLTAGRQKVFILIMFVSLMGRMGLPNLFQSGLMRSAFGLFMLTVLISSMVNAIITWRRERESQSEKEMAKIKESLFNDGTKVIEQMEKGKLAFLRDYLKEVNKKFDQQLKRVAEESLSGNQATADPESQQQEANRKKLDERAKKLNELGRQITKLTTDARTLHMSAVGATREAARKHVTVPTSDDPTREYLAVEEPVDTDPTPSLPVQALPVEEVSIPDLSLSMTTTNAHSPEPDEQEQPIKRQSRVSLLAQRREARRKEREAAHQTAE